MSNMGDTPDAMHKMKATVSFKLLTRSFKRTKRTRVSMDLAPQACAKQARSETGALHSKGLEFECISTPVEKRIDARFLPAAAPSALLAMPTSFVLSLYTDGFVLLRPSNNGAVPAADSPREGITHPYDRASRPFLQAVNSGRMPADLLSGIDCKFVEGHTMIELRDYRRCWQQTENGGAAHLAPATTRVLLRPTQSSSWADAEEICNSNSLHGYEQRLRMEACVLRECNRALQLDPTPTDFTNRTTCSSSLHCPGHDLLCSVGASAWGRRVVPFAPPPVPDEVAPLQLSKPSPGTAQTSVFALPSDAASMTSAEAASSTRVDIGAALTPRAVPIATPLELAPPPPAHIPAIKTARGAKPAAVSVAKAATTTVAAPSAAAVFNAPTPTPAHSAKRKTKGQPASSMNLVTELAVEVPPILSPDPAGTPTPTPGSKKKASSKKKTRPGAATPPAVPLEPTAAAAKLAEAVKPSGKKQQSTRMKSEADAEGVVPSLANPQTASTPASAVQLKSHGTGPATVGGGDKKSQMALINAMKKLKRDARRKDATPPNLKDSVNGLMNMPYMPLQTPTQLSLMQPRPAASFSRSMVFQTNLRSPGGFPSLILLGHGGQRLFNDPNHVSSTEVQMKIVLSGSPPDQQLLANVLPDGRLPMHMLPVLGIQGGTSSSSDDNAKVVYLPPLGSMEDASRFISTFTKCAATEHLVLVRNEPVQGFASMGSASLPNSPNPALGPMHGAPVSMQGMGVVGVGVGMGMAGVPSQMPQMGMMGTGGMAQAGMMPPGAHPMARTPSPGVQGMGPSQGGLGHHYPGGAPMGMPMGHHGPQGYLQGGGHPPGMHHVSSPVDMMRSHTGGGGGTMVGMVMGPAGMGGPGTPEPPHGHVQVMGGMPGGSIMGHNQAMQHPPMHPHQTIQQHRTQSGSSQPLGLQPQWQAHPNMASHAQQ